MHSFILLMTVFASLMFTGCARKPTHPAKKKGGSDEENSATGSRVLLGHTYRIWSVAISPDGRWLVTGSQDNTARLWDLNAENPAAESRELKGHTESILSVAISPDSRWLVTGSQDDTARLWDLKA